MFSALTPSEGERPESKGGEREETEGGGRTQGRRAVRCHEANRGEKHEDGRDGPNVH